MNRFAYSLGQAVVITCSEERGNILSRAEHLTGENNYFIRYKAADGRATEAWWSESALSTAPIEVA